MKKFGRRKRALECRTSLESTIGGGGVCRSSVKKSSDWRGSSRGKRKEMTEGVSRLI
jgi:hypothetical protein